MLRFLGKRCFSSLLKEHGVSLANLRALEATDSAVSKLSELKQKFPEKTLRIAVEPGGCHGFQYNFTLDQQIDPEDIVFTNEQVKLICDTVTWSMIKESKLDYSNELIGAAFQIIDNPAVDSGCGCGVSFGLKQ